MSKYDHFRETYDRGLRNIREIVNETPDTAIFAGVGATTGTLKSVLLEAMRARRSSMPVTGRRILTSAAIGAAIGTGLGLRRAVFRHYTPEVAAQVGNVFEDYRR